MEHGPLISGSFLSLFGLILLVIGLFNFQFLLGFGIFGIILLIIGIIVLLNNKEDKIEEIK